MPLQAAQFRVSGGSYYAHLFENPSAGVSRALYWSATVQFAAIDYLGESWESSLTMEWLPLAARQFSGVHSATQQLFPAGEASLYLAQHHGIHDWRCTLAWDGHSSACLFDFDVSLDFPGLDKDPVPGLHLAGTAELAFDGLIVVPDNLTPQPSSVDEATVLLSEYFDGPLVGTDEGWRYTFRP